MTDIHPDVLAAHAQFGGDLEIMQKCYEWHDLKKVIDRHEVALSSLPDTIHRVMVEHCGEGGAPRVDWYRLRNELIQAVNSSFADAPKSPSPETQTKAPAGWKLVPIEPTPAMVEAGRIARMAIAGGYDGPSSWEAMLNAAPEPSPKPQAADAITQAVAIERERCARIAEGSAQKFDFLKAFADHDDLEYGRNGARVDIARAIREGDQPREPQTAEPFAWYWYDATGALMITGDDRRPEVPANAKPLYEHPAPPRQSQMTG